MIRRLIGVGIVCVIVLVVVYGGLVIYGNIKHSSANPFDAPDPDKASYSIRVQNTGNYLLANDVTQDGNIIIVNGYWELVGQEFKFKEQQLILDKRIFGEITVKRR